ncbi:MAG: c-type cytochrome [Alphaproteobacteria bacterium]|nr:c-type cytochrome [Alphaproteobacteria bacterium]
MRVILMIAAALAALPLAGLSGVYALSEARLRDVSRGPAFSAPIPTDAASIEHGRHVARTRGCFGCHGQKLQGWNFDEQWDWPERAVAPNLARYARENDVATIEAAVRQGIGRNGRALMSMPSFNFRRLTDEDMAALIAFLKSAPVVEAQLPTPKLGWAARWGVVTGAEPRVPDWVAVVPELAVDPIGDRQRAAGEYLAMTMCNECHGLDVRGQWFYMPPTPDLGAVVPTYSRAAFETLIETGISADGRELGLMRLVAPDRFPSLTDAEVDALYAYLTSLAAAPVANAVKWRPAQ